MSTQAKPVEAGRIGQGFEAELVDVSSLKAHPRNYRTHLPEQLEHLTASIREHGLYRNVVVANDGTILAGHGVVEACKKLGLAQIPVARLSVGPDDPRALKVLTGDNEIARLGEVDDRRLSEILKELADQDVLLGTGFDKLQLANLVFVTRHESEIKDFDAAKAWVGMPTYDESAQEPDELAILVTFKSEEDRDLFVKEKDLRIKDKHMQRRWLTQWPKIERRDLASVKFEEESGETKE